MDVLKEHDVVPMANGSFDYTAFDGIANSNNSATVTVNNAATSATMLTAAVAAASGGDDIFAFLVTPSNPNQITDFSATPPSMTASRSRQTASAVACRREWT